MFGRRDYAKEVFKLSSDGRVFKLDVHSNSIQTVADGLKFANGLYLNEEDGYLLVAETSAGRIQKIDLKTNEMQLFAELPCNNYAQIIYIYIYYKQHIYKLKALIHFKKLF